MRVLDIVLNWLNEVTPPDISFYLVKLEAFRIEKSPPAPFFSIISEPSEEAKERGRTKEQLAKRHGMRLKFWKQLLGW